MRHPSQDYQTRITSGGTPIREERLSTFTAADILKLFFAILLPPLGVFLEVGLKGHFWLNILLTLLGYVPGIIHAIYIIVTRR